MDTADTALKYRNDFWQEISSGQRNIFSFETDGKRVFSSECPLKILKREGERIFTRWELPGVNAELKIDFLLDSELPFLEYECFFENTGAENSGVITGFKAVDISETLPGVYYEKSHIHYVCSYMMKMVYYLGSIRESCDFQRREKILTQRINENSLELGAAGYGRPSEINMPFFRGDFDEFNGLSFAIGWSGSWSASARLEGRNFKLNAGMPLTSFYLKPGETLRAPGAFIGFRRNIAVPRFINLHRRYMMKRHAPYDSCGKALLPPISAVDWGGVESDNMKILLKHIHDSCIPIETHWIDAGWMGEDAPCPHPCDPTPGPPSNWSSRVGTLRINRYSHPEGLREVADLAAQYGISTLLWFEPERFHKDCGEAVLREHPEWFTPVSAPPGSLFIDLGNPDARKWLTGTIISFMEKEHITHFRQDFNLSPWECWYSDCEPDRVGVKEMLHVDGLYRFWRDLREHFPDMYIDNCASGGRRLDYMLADHSFPLCQDDYAAAAKNSFTAIQLQNIFLNEIYPLHSTLSWMPEGDIYAAFSSGCGMGVGSKCWNFPSIYPDAEFGFDLYRDTLTAIRDIRTCMTGNYYLLTPYPEKRESFCAIQSFNEKENLGFVLVFRRSDTPGPEFRCPLFDIDGEADYEVSEFRSTESCIMKGREFSNFSILMPEPRSVKLLFYRKK